MLERAPRPTRGRRRRWRASTSARGRRGTGGCCPTTISTACAPRTAWATTPSAPTDPSAPSTIVAVEDGVICGFATTGPSARRRTSPTQGEVLALYVDPEAWGLGVGRRLMAEARERLGRSGFTDAVLWVLVGNDRAERFYRLDGGCPTGGRRTVEVWGVAVDEVRYRRRLP